MLSGVRAGRSKGWSLPSDDGRPVVEADMHEQEDEDVHQHGDVHEHEHEHDDENET